MFDPNDSYKIADALEEYNKYHLLVQQGGLDVGHKFDNNFLHAAIGMSTEAAELLDIIKKKYWGKKVDYSKQKIIDEAGDLFWYFWLLMQQEGIDFNEILAYNTRKLKERYNNV